MKDSAAVVGVAAAAGAEAAAAVSVGAEGAVADTAAAEGAVDSVADRPVVGFPAAGGRLRDRVAEAAADALPAVAASTADRLSEADVREAESPVGVPAFNPVRDPRLVREAGDRVSASCRPRVSGEATDRGSVLESDQAIDPGSAPGLDPETGRPHCRVLVPERELARVLERVSVRDWGAETESRTCRRRVAIGLRICRIAWRAATA
jgi:hypothetical protein